MFAGYVRFITYSSVYDGMTARIKDEKVQSHSLIAARVTHFGETLTFLLANYSTKLRIAI